MLPTPDQEPEVNEEREGDAEVERGDEGTTTKVKEKGRAICLRRLTGCPPQSDTGEGSRRKGEVCC